MTAINSRAMNGPAARRWLLTGQVQGAGVRPAIARLAARLGLRGDVCNTRDGLRIELEGDAVEMQRFRQQLFVELPEPCRIDNLHEIELPVTGRMGVAIIRDHSDTDQAPLATPVPADRRVCEACRDDVRSDNGRRADFPFTACTACGPRYTIIRQMPFEREATAMHEFPLCEACRAEYRRPDDRRFHAQTTSCPRCGPTIWADAPRAGRRDCGRQALAAVRVALRDGHVVALRGPRAEPAIWSCL